MGTMILAAPVYDFRAGGGIHVSRMRLRRSAWCSGVVESDGEVMMKKNVVCSAHSTSSRWGDFVRHVSGEWIGHGADFSDTGKPLLLPQSVVPEACKQWGLDMYDWQTICLTLAGEEPRFFRNRTVPLLPTVGCDMSATPYKTEDRDFDSTEQFFFREDGSYVAVWPGRGVARERREAGASGKVVVRDVSFLNEWEVEHCLVREGSTRGRLRLLQQFASEESGREKPYLKGITVYIEQWEGPFRRWEFLEDFSACGSPFGASEPCQLSLLSGSWHVEDYHPSDGFDANHLPEKYVGQLVFQGSRSVQRLQAIGLVPLPQNLWSFTGTSASSDSFIAEAGWLVEPNMCIISTCELAASGRFMGKIRTEQRLQ